MYGGKVHLKYLDKSHRYYIRHRQEDGTWGKATRPVSATGMMDAVLEKNGVWMWKMGLPLAHLFGFYDFKGDDGEQKTGFSKGKGVLWNLKNLLKSKDEVLKFCVEAMGVSKKKQDEGANIGTMVHDAAEQYLKGNLIKIDIDRYGLGRVFENQEEMDEFNLKAPEEVAMANKAFDAFKNWWNNEDAEVLMAEQIVYSLSMNMAGTFDYLIKTKERGIVLADLKTTKASVKAGAPDGVYYSYFIQLGLYASTLIEMGHEQPNDLLIISCRKDGGFRPLYASEIGLSVQDCIDWARSVSHCHKMMKRTQKSLSEITSKE